MADKNPFPDENNTGHIWDDDLRELDNPPPGWWMIGFWASIAFCIGYGILYPFWPSFTAEGTHTKGVLGWTAVGEMKAAVSDIDAVRGSYEGKLANKSAKEILADAELTDYAQRAAKVTFGDFCAPCHGSGGQGGPGYPVLADDDWLFGGKIETIVQTITNGRKGMMTPHANVLEANEVDTLANYVVGLSKGKNDAAGKALFTAKGCVGCHGMDGKGLQIMGAPNLTDAIWRFKEEDQLASVKQTILHGVNFPADPKSREAIMPNFSEKLSADEIKKLAVFVHTLGGGQ